MNRRGEEGKGKRGKRPGVYIVREHSCACMPYTFVYMYALAQRQGA